MTKHGRSWAKQAVCWNLMSYLSICTSIILTWLSCYSHSTCKGQCCGELCTLCCPVPSMRMVAGNFVALASTTSLPKRLGEEPYSREGFQDSRILWTVSELAAYMRWEDITYVFGLQIDIGSTLWELAGTIELVSGISDQAEHIIQAA